ncbi:TcpQ domain-containing protein [Pollutimonas sp. M17]|uniref:TcpQ domain-containing protein n=1 Tax=Pollutimonas sp. M17 TaxID=2962065 RepID=UPI0021F401A7|nr:TcpQ domain-containing protein [Pollutimonas sp. M17]UYO92376.1 TcpQ domain-containing protein [Pollutimonas sp. M17]
MARLLAAFLLLGVLTACAGVHDWPSFVRTMRADKAAAVQYNFDWELSGHRAVAPVQVFDDGRKTWLQFSPQQPVPAIFADGARGGRPLAYVREGPYVVLDGVWPTLVLRGGHLKSTVRRAAGEGVLSPQAPDADAQPVAALAPTASAASVNPVNQIDQADILDSIPVMAEPTMVPAAVAPARSMATATTTATGAEARTGASVEQVPDQVPGLSPGRPGPASPEVQAEWMARSMAGSSASGKSPTRAMPSGMPDSSASKSPSAAPLSSSSVSALTAASFDLSGAAPTGRYQVGPQDLTLRSALARWARQSGWTFEPEHWAIDADIPIVGAASFEPDFKLAVRELVASTELSDRPAQPCFYSNRVLRVVPYAQPCDRTVGATRPS